MSETELLLCCHDKWGESFWQEALVTVILCNKDTPHSLHFGQLPNHLGAVRAAHQRRDVAAHLLGCRNGAEGDGVQTLTVMVGKHQ